MGQSTRGPSTRAWPTSVSTADLARESSANATHDFRNMLQVASSALRVTRRQLTANGNAETASVLGDVLDALDRASLIAQGILSRSAPHRASRLVSIPATIQSLSRLLRHALGEAILLRIRVPENLPLVMCDPSQLDEALINLAVNARDAMPDGGDLVIEGCECTRFAHLSRCVVIEVSDSGCGMSPDVLERACRPFFTTKDPGQGTGLGLTAVRNFVEQWGGSVEIQSSEAKGTCVRLHLPSSAVP